MSETTRNLFAYLVRTHEVPQGVHEDASEIVSAHLAAFDELNELVDATPRVPWVEGEWREDARDIIENRYIC